MELPINNILELNILASCYKIFSDTKNLKIDTDTYQVFINDKGDRFIRGKDNKFHMYFRKADGFTAKWGMTFKDDPAYNPYGNEIADIEITKCCRGIRVPNGDGSFTRKPCVFCYKSNTPSGSYMNLDTFKKVFALLDKQKTMTQIAFGVDAEASEELNPDIWKILEYTKDHGVTPNITVADITPETANKIVSLCGACAVSAYQTNKNCCYNSVKMITDEAKRQGKEHFACNIHLMISAETLPFVYEVIQDYQTDERLKDMNAIVFLSLKQKGRGEHFNKISEEDFKKIVDLCLEKNIRFGMDSCSANKFLYAIKDRKNYDEMASYVENCESFGLFSMYIDCHGNYYPCSFMERTGKWKTGINLLKINNFIEDVWYSDKLCEDRKNTLEKASCNGGCTSCPFYDI